MKTKLFYSPGACSLAVHMVLEEIGKPFETELVLLKDGAQHQPAFQKINPMQRVPALEINGQIITETGAILHHLADLHPEASLLPQVGDSARAKSYEWASFLGSSVHIAFAQIWRPGRFSMEIKDHENISKTGRQKIDEYFSMIEQKLSQSKYALGENYSVCDPYLLVFYRWGYRIEKPMDVLYPSWTKQANLVLNRPAVQKTMQKEGISLK